jgi:glycosyltransferase involved in cell wall biosynthesis
MKLLIITQAIDENNPVLGFFCRWVEEFAKHYEKLTVICLEKGQYRLPKNVEVYSLGKEKPTILHSPFVILNKFKYVFNFYKLIFRFRNDHSAVFVHMNEEYVILAGLWWRFMGKKLGMFRNHIRGTWKTPIAVALSHVVFCTSPYSYTARFKKTKIVPAGIDIEKSRAREFKPRISRSILSLGRIDPVKNVDVLIKALGIMEGRGVDFSATIVGDPSLENRTYYEGVIDLAELLVKKGKIKFHPAVPNDKTPEFYCSHEIFVNLTNPGSLDKTVFSAMVSGMVVVLCNVSFEGIVPDKYMFIENDPEDLANKLESALDVSKTERQNLTSSLRSYVEENHSLEKTVSEILKIIK